MFDNLPASIAPIVAVAGLGWYLRDQFRKVKDDLLSVIENNRAKNEQRHEENLRRFEKIYVAIARMGNGFKH